MKTSLAASRRKAVRELKKGRTFFLSGHVKPDGDCLGSALALRLALKRLGKKADVYSADPVPFQLSLLPGADTVKVGRRPKGAFDVAILLECSSPERSGGLIDFGTQAGVVINIDSHLRAQAYGTVNLIEPEISSTAQQVYELLPGLGVKLDKQIATCLYVGLVTDTGRFQYDNTSPSCLRMAAVLIEAGVEAARLNDRLFATLPLPALKLLGRALNGLRLEADGKVGVQALALDDFNGAGAGAEHTEDIVNFGMMPPGVQAAILLKEEKSGIRVSLRSRGRVDVSRVAAAFGGGGHHNAAGCTLRLPLPEAEKALLGEISSQL